MLSVWPRESLSAPSALGIPARFRLHEASQTRQWPFLYREKLRASAAALTAPDAIHVHVHVPATAVTRQLRVCHRRTAPRCSSEEEKPSPADCSRDYWCNAASRPARGSIGYPAQLQGVESSFSCCCCCCWPICMQCSTTQRARHWIRQSEAKSPKTCSRLGTDTAWLPGRCDVQSEKVASKGGTRDTTLSVRPHRCSSDLFRSKVGGGLCILQPAEGAEPSYGSGAGQVGLLARNAGRYLDPNP
jgi:hypothetical protein